MNANALSLLSKSASVTLAEALRAYNAGDVQVAAPLFEVVLESQPLLVDALVGVGLCYWRLNRAEEGVHVLRKALAINPRDINALRGLGLLLYSASRLDEARELLDRCVATDPKQHQAWLTLGLIQQRGEDLAGAEASFKKALELEPHYAEAMNNLGTVYLEQRQFGPARSLFMEAIRENPALVDAYRSLARLLREMGTDIEALAILKRAVRIDPNNANAWNEIGGLYRDMSNTPRSIAAYEKAIEVDPNHVDAKGNLSCVFSTDGRYLEAQKLCGELLDVDPKAMGVRVRKALIIPAIMESNESITRTREELHAALDDLKNYSGTIEDPLGQVGSTNFYLAYHGHNDRELQKKTADLFRQVTPILTYEAPHIGRRRRDGKIRLGICSRHLSFHTIGILWADLFARLDRDRFEISLFHTQPLAHRIPQSLIQRVDHEFRLPINMVGARGVIERQELDILYYPDLGMEPLTYFLAFNRLAPVQCVTWGHPLTTGISTIDYFVSSKELELPHARDHYTEQLIKLDTLNTYYLRPKTRETITRGSLGVRADSNIYMCPQTLFKFHPDFDQIIQGVLEGDPNGDLVLLEGTCAHHSTLIKERLQRNVPSVIDRIRFIPRLSHDGFLALVKMADVMLDPIHFGGGSTTLQALSFGTPVVTLPSEFLRGRISYACYRHMGTESLIAKDIDDYCRIAVEFGQNRDLRDATRKELCEKSSILYSNQKVVTECEQFLIDVFSEAWGIGEDMTVRKILLVNYDSLTDALLLTAAVRDLQVHSHGGYQVDVHTLGMSIWDYNNHLTRLDWRSVPWDGESELAANEYGFAEQQTKIICYDTEIQVVMCSKKGHFPSSERLRNINSYHQIHAFGQDISNKLGLTAFLPIGEMRGVVTLSDIERGWMSQVEEAKSFNNFWILVTGGPETQSARWWDPQRYQKVVDEFKGKITFVQCGLEGEHHPRLKGVIDLVGKTDLRQLIRLMYHAAGYVGAPGFLMHLAAATPVRPFERNGRPRPNSRAAVVISGGQEPYQWFAYEGHQVLHVNGMLPCCEVGGCGKTRCEIRHCLERSPEQLCEMPVQIGRGGVTPKCLDMITVKMVIDRIKLHFDGGAYFYDDDPPKPPEPVTMEVAKEGNEEKPKPNAPKGVQAVYASN